MRFLKTPKLVYTWKNGKKVKANVDYNREYMRNLRWRKKMKELTGFSYHPRFIEEEKIFTKEDYEYIKIMNSEFYIKKKDDYEYIKNKKLDLFFNY